MARNRLWLFNGYRTDGSLIGELEGTCSGHALDEFEAEYPDAQCVRVKRIKGSGRPWPKIITTDRHLVRYIQGGKRHRVIVNTYNYSKTPVTSESAARCFEGPGVRVTSVKRLSV